MAQYLSADFSHMTEEDEVQHLRNTVDDNNRCGWMIERDGEIVGNVEINEIKELG